MATKSTNDESAKVPSRSTKLLAKVKMTQLRNAPGIYVIKGAKWEKLPSTSTYKLIKKNAKRTRGLALPKRRGKSKANKDWILLD